LKALLNPKQLTNQWNKYYMHVGASKAGTSGGRDVKCQVIRASLKSFQASPKLRRKSFRSSCKFFTSSLKSLPTFNRTVGGIWSCIMSMHNFDPQLPR